MLRRRILWIILPVLIVLAGGSYAAYRFLYVPSRTTQPTYQTATVTRGTVSITADGSGTLVAPTTLNLAFSSSGTLAELHVRVGDKVSAGDVLARIDDTAARQAVADAQLQVRQATDNLASAKDTAALVRAVEQANAAKSTVERQALLEQIEQAMSPAQVSAIAAMQLTEADAQTWLQSQATGGTTGHWARAARKDVGDECQEWCAGRQHDGAGGHLFAASGDRFAGGAQWPGWRPAIIGHSSS